MKFSALVLLQCIFLQGNGCCRDFCPRITAVCINGGEWISALVLLQCLFLQENCCSKVFCPRITSVRITVGEWL